MRNLTVGGTQFFGLETTARAHRAPSTWPCGPGFEMAPVEERDLPEAQAVYEAAPRFFEREGCPAVPADMARDDWAAVPPDFPRERKWYLGIRAPDGGPLFGLADYLDGYPQPGIGWLGLLVLAETHQRRGLGRRCFEALAAWAVRKFGARELRLGVYECNEPAVAFWKAMGFTPLSSELVEGKPCLVMTRPASGFET